MKEEDPMAEKKTPDPSPAPPGSATNPSGSPATPPEARKNMELGDDQLEQVSGGILINLGPTMAQINKMIPKIVDEALKNKKV
jgi:hypothetical protein